MLSNKNNILSYFYWTPILTHPLVSQLADSSPLFPACRQGGELFSKYDL
jgi:hypothetical protein